MAREDYDSDVDLLKGSRRMMAQMLLRRQQQANPNLAGNILQGLSMGLMGAFEGMDSRQREAAQNEIIDVLARRSQESPSAAAATAAITAAGPPVKETKPSEDKQADAVVADAKPQYLRPQADEPAPTLSSEPGANPRAQELGRALLMERGRQRMGETAPPDDGSVWPPLNPAGAGDRPAIEPNAMDLAPGGYPRMNPVGVGDGRPRWWGSPPVRTFAEEPPAADATLGDIPIGPQVPSMMTPASIDAASYSPMMMQGGQQAPPPGPSPGAPPPANFMDYGTTEWPVGSSGRPQGPPPGPPAAPPQQGSPEWQALQAYQASQGRPPQAPPSPAMMQPGYQPGPQSLAAPEQSPLASAQGQQAIQAAMPQQGGDPYSRGISSLESGSFRDPYTARGPMVRTQGGLHQALGKYQVMDFNVGPWTEKHLGQRLSKEEFLRSPEAQEAVFRGQFGEYVQKYGPEGAARAWIGGPGGVDNPNARAISASGKPIGLSVGEYGSRAAASFGDARKGVLGPRQAPQEPPQPAPYQVAQMGGQPPGPPQQAAQSGLIQRLEELRRSPNPETRELARKHLYEEYTRKPSWEHMDTPVGRTFFNKNDPRQSFTVQHSPETLRAAAEQKGREAEATERGQIRAKTEATTAAAKPGLQMAGTIITTDIDRALDIIQKNPNTTTGLAGAAMRYAPTSAAHSVDKLIAGIKPNLSLQTIQAMRSASPTGASGLGAVTKEEHEMLMNAYGSLDLAQDDKQLIYNLSRLKRVWNAIVHEGPEAAARAAAPPPAGGGQTKGGVKWSIEP